MLYGPPKRKYEKTGHSLEDYSTYRKGFERESMEFVKAG